MNKGLHPFLVVLVMIWHLTWPCSICLLLPELWLVFRHFCFQSHSLLSVGVKRRHPIFLQAEISSLMLGAIMFFILQVGSCFSFLPRQWIRKGLPVSMCTPPPICLSLWFPDALQSGDFLLQPSHLLKKLSEQDTPAPITPLSISSFLKPWRGFQVPELPTAEGMGCSYSSEALSACQPREVVSLLFAYLPLPVCHTLESHHVSVNRALIF